MVAREVASSTRLPHPPEGVWDFLTATDLWRRWWWGDDALVRADPGWEVGAHLVFASGWSPVITEWSPPSRLAFDGHRFDLSDDGGGTRLDWTYVRPATPLGLVDLLPDDFEEVDADLQRELQTALGRLAEALEASVATLGPGFTPGPTPGGASASTVPPEPAPGPPRQVRVFVSSTFKDMQVERDELGRRAFVELRRACEERGVAWADVDLRWGITDEQRAEGEVLPICLAEIERCRPFFIGVLGERYGWVPETVPDDLVARDPRLAEDAGRSITAMEIIHGVLDDPGAAQHASFYLRDPAYVEELPPEVQGDHREGPTAEEVERHGPAEAERRAAVRRRRLAELKERILASGLPVTRYRDPRELSPLVVRDLMGALDRLFPLESVPSAREREAGAHLNALREAERGYVARPGCFDRLDEHVRGDGLPLVVTGETGSGKTALLGRWLAARRRDHPDEPVIVHVVGATPESTSWIGMVQRILGELAEHLGAEVEVPDEPRALQQAFAAALHTAAARGRWVLVIDGLEQLEDRDQALDLRWLPEAIPPNVRLVASTSPGRPTAEVDRRGWPTLAVEPLGRDERERLVRDQLATYGKALSDEQLERVAASAQVANPLFARTLVEELRLHGDPRTLDEAIDRHLRSDGLPGLLDLVLGRFEADYERDRPGLVGEAMALLWAARRGLGDEELRDLLGVDRQRLPGRVWSPLRLAAQHLLSDRSGYIGLAHDAVRRAVAARYLASPEQEQEAHAALAAYFHQREPGPRRIEELPWQYGRLGRWEDLARLLADLDGLEAAWQADPLDVRRFWAEVEEHLPGRMGEALGPAVESPPESTAQVEVLATLLWNAGYLDEALRLRRTLTARARLRDDPLALAVTLGNEAHVLHRQGAWDQALELYQEQASIARQHGHREALAVALGGQAAVHRKRGHLGEALDLFREQEAILLRLEDDAGRQGCLGDQAQVLFEQSRLDEAMDLRREQARLCREVGHADGLANALEAQSTILLVRHDLDGALACSRQAEETFRALGNRAGLATALANQALILRDQGDLDAALVRLAETEDICRAMGERQDLAVALEAQAVIHGDRGDTDRALRLFREAEDICRALGFATGLQATLANHGRVLLQRGDADGALVRLEESERICRDLGSPRALAECLNLKGTALHRSGRAAEAEATWQEVRDLVEDHGLASQ